MLLINMTGLKRFYWTPSFERMSDGDGLWYATARWLGVEVTAYSREMGIVVIRRFNAMAAASIEGE